MHKLLKRIVAVLVVINMTGILTACGFFGGLTSSSEKSDSAPRVKLNPAKIKDAVPRVEAKSPGGNRSTYVVRGRKYKVLDSAEGYRERGKASWYGVKFHGRKTANGETYDMYAMTAAHKHLPLPSYVQVKNLENNKQIVVRVNDRGPFYDNRIIDLSYAAATKLGILKKGTASVEIKVIDPKRWKKEQKKLKRVAGKKTQKATKKSITPISKNNTHTNKEELLYLQIAAYESLAAAQSLQNRLLSIINNSTENMRQHNVVIHPVEGQQLYRVRIGPLSDKNYIEQLKQHAMLASFGKMYTVSETR